MRGGWISHSLDCGDSSVIAYLCPTYQIVPFQYMQLISVIPENFKKKRKRREKREKNQRRGGTMGGTVAGGITKADANTTHKI